MKFAISKSGGFGRRVPLGRRLTPNVGRPPMSGGRWNHGQAGPREATIVQANSRTSLAGRCAIIAVLVYFIRGTVLPWHVPVPDAAWIFLSILALTVAGGLSAAGGGTWRWSWVMVLLAFALGLGQAEDRPSAIEHWIGLVLLILAVGPVILNPLAVEVRASAWQFTVKGLTTLLASFVVWYGLHLPSLAGKEYFTSFMNQSMLLGPLAGLGVVIASVKALHHRSWRWGWLAVFGLVPLLASGSRLAVLSTGAAGCFFMIRRKPLLGGTLALLFLLAVVGFMHHGQDQDNDDSTSFTNALAKKGIANSRADLWQSRIDEFKSSPLIGIGVAMGTGSGADQDANGGIRVEPGSSYLAILSMTGAVGVIAFFSALGLLVYGFYAAQAPPSLERDILSVTGVFLAVHGVAEGWILGFGSPLCFLFWLWLGNFGDAGQAVPMSAVSNRRGGAMGRAKAQGQFKGTEFRKC